MQALLIPLITALASTAGGFVLNKVFGPKAPSVSAAPTGPTRAEAIKTEIDNRTLMAKLANRELPGLQERLGGSVSPEYQASMAALLSGNPQIVDWYSIATGSGNGGTSTTGLMGTNDNFSAAPSFSSTLKADSGLGTNDSSGGSNNFDLGGFGGFGSLGGLDLSKLASGDLFGLQSGRL